MKKLVLGLTFVLAGCCSTYPGQSYVEADEETYKMVKPKLEEWATGKDAEWQEIVKNKMISWKARIDRAKQKGEEEKKDD